ncbi:hypothetical protein HZC30_02400 [Candidatus Woesearchaeota archaeon]|nr:hypothetical protein [Candidatus Woesearchaeota archaeon]
MVADTALSIINSAANTTNLKDFFTRDRYYKIIIEGGYQDNWRNITLDVGEFCIPENTLRIHPGTDYDLDLTSRLNEQGAMETVSEKPENALEIDYNFFLGIQRPRGILVEDGRLFYDKSLLTDQPDLAMRFLSYLSAQWGSGRSFHQIYREIQKHRRKN